ncbi:MAG TPA: hypothetical protein VI795_01815 [Patescibacteria group bacterium]|nr:hypothetical protein [Patescibacteria group bacterium]
MNNIMIKNIHNREEFEESATESLKAEVDKARQTRDKIRLLEDNIIKKEENIRNYKATFEELTKELVIIQAKMYAGGTT